MHADGLHRRTVQLDAFKRWDMKAIDAALSEEIEQNYLIALLQLPEPQWRRRGPNSST